MNTRIIVCGSRTFTDRELCFFKLDEILPSYENPEIVSGHARGADMFGEGYAKMHSLPFTIFPAEWSKYGKSAGMIRNKQMLQYALGTKPVIIAFWDGKSRGTENMIEQGQEAGAEVIVVEYEP